MSRICQRTTFIRAESGTAGTGQLEWSTRRSWADSLDANPTASKVVVTDRPRSRFRIWITERSSSAVAVRAVGSFDLSGQIRERHDLLRACREVTQADLATGQFVTDDDRKVRSISRGGLELLAELASAEF